MRTLEGTIFVQVIYLFIIKINKVSTVKTCRSTTLAQHAHCTVSASSVDAAGVL